MAPLVTHLVIGERVLSKLRYIELTPAARGAFLLGCMLVDVHGFSDIDRRQTHFIGRLEEDGPAAFQKSCANFMSQLDTLLVRPWNDLAEAEQAFIAGYLCHLAADEPWKELGWALLQKFEIASLNELPVPGEVSMTAYDVLIQQQFEDFAAIISTLNQATIPNVLAHIPHQTLQRMWDIARPHVLAGGTPESYFSLLERNGMSPMDIEPTRQQHATYWNEALAMIYDLGGVEPYLQAAVGRALQVMPQLWPKASPSSSGSFHKTSSA